MFVCVGGGHTAAETLLFSAFCPCYFEGFRKHIGPEHKVLEYCHFNFGHLHALKNTLINTQLKKNKK